MSSAYPNQEVLLSVHRLGADTGCLHRGITMPAMTGKKNFTPPLVSVSLGLFPLPQVWLGVGRKQGRGDLSHLQTLEPAGLVTVPQQLQRPLGHQPHLKRLCRPLG